jgi:CDP-paratose 2-epimerase
VRDVLHVQDLGDLIDLQLAQRTSLNGDVVNAGGGLANSVSLLEFTRHCEALTGTTLEITSRPETRPGDVPVYITDNTKVHARFGWEPRRSVDDLARDLHQWIREQEPALRAALGLA